MSNEQWKRAKADIVDGMKAWRIWLLLGWQDIRLRYRRSQLGPFWITLGTAVMIYSMGFLYAKLFRIELRHYYPFLASGIVTWMFISAVIMESSDAFIESQSYLKQIKLPYTIYPLRVITRNFIILLHNVLPIIPITIYFHVVFSFSTLLMLLLGVAVMLLCGFFYSMILAIIGTRYRDVKPIINSLIQVIFLTTPIMWQPSMLPPRFQFAAQFNPFNQIIELLRAPLNGHAPSQFSMIFSFGVLLIGAVMLLVLLWRTRRRIAFWI